MLSTIIVNWNTKDILYKCLQSIQGKEVDEVIVVDNASTDGSVEMVKCNFKDILLILNTQNYGFAQAANTGIKKSSGDLILLLNSDVFIEQKAIKQMKQFMSNNPNIKITSPLLFSPEGEKLRTLRPIPNLLFMLLQLSFILRIFPFVKAILPKYIQAAALFIRRDVYKKIGFFDERFFFYTEDVDFCLRAHRQGIKMIIAPTARAIHLCGESSKKKSRRRYFIKNIDANLKFIEKYYPAVITNLVRNLVIIHFFVRIIFLNILSISYVDRGEINERICIYRGVKNLCRN